MVKRIRVRGRWPTAVEAPPTSSPTDTLEAAIDGWRKLLVGMAGGGYLTETLFRAVEGMAASSYEQGLRENRSEKDLLQLIQPLLQSLLSMSDNFELIVSDRTEELLRRSEDMGLTFQGGAYQAPSLTKLAPKIALEYLAAAIGSGLLFTLGAVLYYSVGARVAVPLLSTLAGAVGSMLVSLFFGRPVVTVPDLELHAGRAALHAGATALAISLLVRAAHATESPEAHLALGEAYLQAGRVGDAQREWNMAVAADAGALEPPLPFKG